MSESGYKIHVSLVLICLLFALYASSCSVPSLEEPQCSHARDAVKRFYGFHFGNDMHPSAENLKLRESYLTGELFKELSASNEEAKDYFTKSENYPKAFRVGTCTLESDDKATLQVLMLWRNETKSAQEEVHVEAVKKNEKWLINKVSN